MKYQVLQDTPAPSRSILFADLLACTMTMRYHALVSPCACVS